MTGVQTCALPILQFSTLWQNYRDGQARIMVALVQVDDAHTLMYLRFYQKLLRRPLLRHVFNRLATPSNLCILHQDRRVVTTQRPMRSDQRMNGKLMEGDRPIVEYRRRRQVLIDAAAMQKGQDEEA